MLDRLGMGDLLDADTSAELSGGQAKRVALARLLASRARPADPRRADQPPRPRCDRVPRGVARRVPGGLVMVTHDRHVLDRVTTRCSNSTAGAPTCTSSGTTAGPATPRTSRVGPSVTEAEAAEQTRPQPRPHRARLAAPRCAGAHQQAEGPHRGGHGAGRGPARCAGPRRRPLASIGTPRLGVEGRRAARRRSFVWPDGPRARVRRRSCSSRATASGSSAPTGPASRRCSSSIAGRSQPDAGTVERRPDGDGSATTTSSVATSTSTASACATPSPVRQGLSRRSRTWR
jgi:hypothetical protein